MLTAVTKTNPGKVRKNNEDLALWDPEIAVLVLADGMGGHNAGEVASRLAIETLHAFLRSSAGGAEVQWPFGLDESAPLIANLLKTAVTLANREVYRSSEERQEFAGMGTTLTAAIVEGAHLTFASIGDSRLYVCSGHDELEQLTRDDSLMGALSGVEGVDPAMLEHHPMRHMLTNVLGKAGEIQMTLGERELVDGDRLLLSSDGLHGALPHNAIQSILHAEPDIDRASDLLIKAALEADGRDNITVVLARYSAK